MNRTEEKNLTKSERECQNSEKTTSQYLEFISPKTKKKIKFYHTFTTLQKEKQGEGNRPLIFWTNGGPGTSSLSAWFKGISSHIIQEDSSTAPNLYNWAKFADVVTTDQPLGSGFSYLSEGENLRTDFGWVSTEYCEFVKTFLIQKGYLNEGAFPSKLLLVGESMSGHFVPESANSLFDYLKSLGKGYEKQFKVGLVSPWIHPEIHYASFREYCFQTNLIGPDEYNNPKLISSEKQCIELLSQPIIMDTVDACFQLTDDIVKYRWAFYDIRVKSEDPSSNKYVLTFKWAKTQKKLQDGGFNDILGIDPTKIDTSNFKRYRRELVDALKVESTMNKIEHVIKMVNSSSDPKIPGREIPLLVMTPDYDMICNYLGARQ